MLKAYALHPPAKNMEFTAPPGIEFVNIDAESLLRATADCTDTFREAFIDGTAPAAYCPLHSLPIASDDEPVNSNVPSQGSAVGIPTPGAVLEKPSAPPSP
jgi:hypothetical protein